MISTLYSLEFLDLYYIHVSKKKILNLSILLAYVKRYRDFKIKYVCLPGGDRFQNVINNYSLIIYT